MGGWGSHRRQRLFERVRKELDKQGVSFYIADNVQNPFIFGDIRTEFLNRAKITLNLTRTWYDDNFSRFALAIPNRSLIVSEPLLTHCPAYRPGIHYVSAPIEKLAETILYYLAHEEERSQIVDNGYQLVTTDLRFGNSIQAIMEAVDKYRSVNHRSGLYHHRGKAVDNTIKTTFVPTHSQEVNGANGNRPPADPIDPTLVAIREYWNSRPLGVQYRSDPTLELGSVEFFAHIRPWMTPYKFPWIMERIEREAVLLKGKHLLEVGCGMGFDSLEFMKRGVRVTATDLTPNAVGFASRHFEIEGVQAEAVRTASALELPFADSTFDAVWADGVLHATGDTARAIAEVRRVLAPGGRAIISHFYRKPSWMYWLHRWGRENIEHKEEDPPVNEFLTEKEILEMFAGFEVVEAVQEHERALPVRRIGLKAMLYTYGFMPLYNRLPDEIARRLAYKFSVTAVKV
jgi:ubiquinone/menaquinone biosynthesis C-methylase UbiE